jgi:hypothetical protein
MANLLGANVGDNYQGILNLGNALQLTIDNTLQPITDGTGVTSSLSISDTSISINDINVGNSNRESGIFNADPNNVNISVNPNTIVISDGYSSGSYASGKTPCAIFEVASTTQGMLLPRMDTGQRDAIFTGLVDPKPGLLIYDTTENKISYYNGTSWVYLTP